MNVVIVDDSEVVAERLERMLNEASDQFRVVWRARSVGEGRNVVRCTTPDVIILDIQMPDGSGIELLEDVKCEAKTPVVIVLTNYPFPQYRERCLRAGADYFFDKSIEFDQVVTVLLGLLRRNQEGAPGHART